MEPCIAAVVAAAAGVPAQPQAAAHLPAIATESTTSPAQQAGIATTCNQSRCPQIATSGSSRPTPAVTPPASPASPALTTAFPKQTTMQAHLGKQPVDTKWPSVMTNSAVGVRPSVFAVSRGKGRRSGKTEVQRRRGVYHFTGTETNKWSALHVLAPFGL